MVSRSCLRVGLWVELKRLTKRLKITLIVIILLILGSFLIRGAATNKIEVHFLDVGQADSTFILLPNQKTMLIDGGNNNDGSFLVDYIKEIREPEINKIDYLVGTHPHADHIGGLDTVINEFEIGKIYLPRVNHNTKTYEDLLIAIDKKGMKIATARAGTVIFSNNSINLEGTILSPKLNYYDELNNNSVVLRLVYGDRAFLFAGDAEAEVEAELVNSGLNLQADILKVGHHGSRTSTTVPFLEAVSPQSAFISVGDNNYGHPAAEVINRLKNRNVKIYRADQQGTVILTSDGNEIKYDKKEMTYEKEEEINGVYISYLSLKDEEIIIKNNTEDTVDLSNWKLVSEKAGQEYIFPAGTKLPASGQIKIISGRGVKADPPEILLWSNAYIWNNDGDPAALYNSSDQLISRYPEE